MAKGNEQPTESSGPGDTKPTGSLPDASGPKPGFETFVRDLVSANVGYARGDRIGPFAILSVLGEGGFGDVYLAEQEAPVRRRVALKVLKPGMDSRAVIARFEQERQALALMDHPNIAKVFDAGTTAQGLPFFVMEYVKGEPITAYCDRHRLTVRQRLELFSRVCDAVQHAHMKGVIHRDLKPSNILVAVTEGGAERPVVIDFGVAKAIAARLTEKTVFTERGVLIGTPEYMSPEQAEMSETNIDTRTDVYALGVILYELLTGGLPFDPKSLREGGYAAIQKMIREVEPPKPSTRLSTMGEAGIKAAADRHARLDELARQLRSELEWIPLKAMRKDRTERYRTAAELGDDVGNYLASRPLIAGPESTGYRVRKFVRRNKGTVVGVGLIATSLVLATGVSVWFGLRESAARQRESEQRAEAVRQQGVAEANAVAADAARAKERSERQRAEKERTRAAGINEFLKSALAASDPDQGGKQGALVVDAMMNALRELDAGAFRDDPETEADLRDTIATILKDNGRTAEAEPLFVQALDTRRRLFKGDHPAVATSLNNLAEDRMYLGHLAEAESLFVEALEMRRRLFKGDHADVASSLTNLAFVRRRLGRAAEAEPLQVQALEIFQHLKLGDHPDMATALNNLALVRLDLGHATEAEPIFVRALEMRQRLFKGDRTDVALSLHDLASVRSELGRTAEAEPLFAQALEMQQRLFKGDHPWVAVSLDGLAEVRQDLGRAAEAESLFVQALDMRRRLYKGDHPDIAKSLNNLAVVRRILGRATEAEPLYVEALDMRRRLYKGDHPYLASNLSDLAFLRQTLGREAEADPMFVEAMEMFRRLFEGDHPNVAHSLLVLAAVRNDLGRTPEAEPLGVESLAMYRRLFKGDHPGVAHCLIVLASIRQALGRAAEAEPLAVEAFEMDRRLFKGDHPYVAVSLSQLARTRQALGKTREAREGFDEAISMLRRLSSNGLSDLARALWCSASARLEGGDAGAALPELEEAVAIAEKVLPREHPHLREYRATLAKCREKLIK